MQTTEIWKDIPGYNGRYQASTLGRVRTGLLSKRMGYLRL